MTATVEISLYPLEEQYESTIVDFILRLRTNKDISVETNGMSTQIIGEYQKVMDILRDEMGKTMQDSRAVFVFKVTSGERSKDKIPESLQ